MPLIRRGIYGSARSDAHNLFQRGQVGIEIIKHKHAPYMDNKALKYLNTLPDEQPKVFMNQHEASSSVESMNKANNPACARTAVDAVCSTHLLVQMCSIRYQAKKEEAWKWEDTLTPYGIKLRDAAFEDINCRHYRINIEEGEEKWICRVTRVGKGYSERTCFFLKYIEQGSVLVVVHVGYLLILMACLATTWLLS